MTALRSATIRRRVAIGWLPALLFFALGGAVAGCSGGASGPGLTYAPPPAAAANGAATGNGMGHTMSHAMPSSAEVDAAWAGRPDYVRAADAATQDAYAFAVARPDVTDWLPCYCGCVAMDHRNNTDCFIHDRQAGAPIEYEEHASYCNVCVEIAGLAKSMLSEGRSMLEIRAAVDARFGGLAPGTDTPLPPA